MLDFVGLALRQYTDFHSKFYKSISFYNSIDMSVLTSGQKDSYILKPLLNSLPKVCNTNILKTCELCIYEIVLIR